MLKTKVNTALNNIYEAMRVADLLADEYEVYGTVFAELRSVKDDLQSIIEKLTALEVAEAEADTLINNRNKDGDN